MVAAIEKTNMSPQGYSNRQMQDAREVCTVMANVPAEKRGMFATMLSVYMDGMAAGAAIAGNHR